MTDLVWIKNPSGAVHQVEPEFAKKLLTGGPNAPEEYDNGGLELIDEDEALALLSGPSSEPELEETPEPDAPEAEDDHEPESEDESEQDDSDAGEDAPDNAEEGD